RNECWQSIESEEAHGQSTRLALGETPSCCLSNFSTTATATNCLTRTSRNRTACWIANSKPSCRVWPGKLATLPLILYVEFAGAGARLAAYFSGFPKTPKRKGSDPLKFAGPRATHQSAPGRLATRSTESETLSSI